MAYCVMTPGTSFCNSGDASRIQIRGKPSGSTQAAHISAAQLRQLGDNGRNALLELTASGKSLHMWV
jgi:hypothetical protein